MTENTLRLARDLRHLLHTHPELSNQEVWTKQTLMAFLKEHTALEVVDRGLWFYAVHRGGPEGKKLAFRADMDALPIEETIDLPYGSAIPGVSHKCGHDGHCATLAAFAMEVDRRGCDNTVYFLFQHAEETGDGAKECAVLLEEEGIEEIFGYHNQMGFPLGEVALREDTIQCASKGMSLFFEGIPAHASDPGVGRNPAQAIARLIRGLPDLYRAEDYQGLVLCTVIHVEIGEIAFGTSASKGVLRVTIRGENEWEMDLLEKKIDALAYGLSAEYGLSYRTEFCDVFPETRNHKESIDRLREVCRDLDIPVHIMPHPERSSEDFGHFTKIAKGAYFFVGNGNDVSHHTWPFDFPDEIMGPALNIFCKLAQVKDEK